MKISYFSKFPKFVAFIDCGGKINTTYFSTYETSFLLNRKKLDLLTGSYYHLYFRGKYNHQMKLFNTSIDIIRLKKRPEVVIFFIYRATCDELIYLDSRGMN